MSHKSLKKKMSSHIKEEKADVKKDVKLMKEDMSMKKMMKGKKGC